MRAVVFDTETTGLIENHTIRLRRQPEVIEIAAVHLDWDGMQDFGTYEMLIRPMAKTLEPVIEKTTSMTIDTLKDAPPFAEVVDKIEKWLSGDIIVGHNLSFDMEMIDLEFERLGRRMPWPKIKICTVEQTVFVHGKRLSLSDLHLLLTEKVHTDAHRALADTQATVRCLRKMRDRKWL